jgi:hypothetical protein
MTTKKPKWAETANDVVYKIYFEYLDQLRESGITNMYGAVPHLRDTFDLDRTEARQILLKWMKTYKNRHPI